MNRIHFTTSLKPFWKGILNLSALFIILICLDIVLDVFFGINLFMDAANETVVIWPIIVLILGIIGGFLSIIYSFTYKIEVTDKGIANKSMFGSTNLNYDEIIEINCDIGIINFKAESKTISLGNLYTNFDDIFEFIEGKIKERTDVNFTGKKKRIEKYFPWALAD